MTQNSLLPRRSRTKTRKISARTNGFRSTATAGSRSAAVAEADDYDDVAALIAPKERVGENGRKVTSSPPRDRHALSQDMGARMQVPRAYRNRRGDRVKPVTYKKEPLGRGSKPTDNAEHTRDD